MKYFGKSKEHNPKNSFCFYVDIESHLRKRQDVKRNATKCNDNTCAEWKLLKFVFYFTEKRGHCAIFWNDWNYKSINIFRVNSWDKSFYSPNSTFFQYEKDDCRKRRKMSLPFQVLFIAFKTQCFCVAKSLLLESKNKAFTMQ